jgi:hypothetical protein
MTNTARKLLLGLLGGSADPAVSFTVTTTGAQTLTIDGLTVSASTTVDWGDGSRDTYAAGAGARTHNYAGAGTWAMRILQPLNVTLIDLRDVKLTGVTGSSISKMTNLTSLTILGLTSPVVWTIGPSAPLPAGLTVLVFYNLGANCPTWNIGPSAPIPAGLTQLYLYILQNITYTSGLETITGLAGDNYMFTCGLSQAQVDAVLRDVYTAAQSRTASGGTWKLDGSNAAPSGVYAAACPPTTGKEYAYELINDSCGVIAAGETWTSITVTGGLP